MRVQDQRYLDILNHLREGKCTDDDIALLKTRVVERDANITSLSGDPIITPGNELGMSINHLFAHEHSLSKTTFVTTAIYNNGNLPTDLVNLLKKRPNTQTQQIPGELYMYVGMPVYLSKNMAVELGLTNGTSGIIKSIHLRNARNITDDKGIHPVDFDKDEDYIVVELNDINMIAPLPGLLANQIPITAKKGNFQYHLKGQKGKDGKPKKVNISLEHFPLVPKFSITSHKSQGMTLGKAFVDLVPVQKNPVEINFSYVPLSRVRRLQDLNILRLFPEHVLRAQVNKDCQAMLSSFQERDACKDL